MELEAPTHVNIDDHICTVYVLQVSYIGHSWLGVRRMNTTHT